MQQSMQFFSHRLFLSRRSLQAEVISSPALALLCGLGVLSRESRLLAYLVAKRRRCLRPASIRSCDHEAQRDAKLGLQALRLHLQHLHGYLHESLSTSFRRWPTAFTTLTDPRSRLASRRAKAGGGGGHLSHLRCLSAQPNSFRQSQSGIWPGLFSLEQTRQCAFTHSLRMEA